MNKNAALKDLRGGELFVEDNLCNYTYRNTSLRELSVYGKFPFAFSVRVAQLDRASDYGSEGRVFESCRVQC